MNNFDFKTIGIAIKRERQKAGMTRDELAEVMHISPRYLISIENDEQAPSFHVFYDLVRMFNISVDQYILITQPYLHPPRDVTQTSSWIRLQNESLLLLRQLLGA